MDVSVIIPAYNCEKTISKLLESLKRQDTSLKYEVIVVDNSSQDRTNEILKYHQKKYPVPLHVLVQPRGVTISAVRNYGVGFAAGQILAFIDSDCVPFKDWLQNGVFLLTRDTEKILLAGGYEPPPNGTWVERAWHSTRAGHKQGTFFVHGGNFFISKALFCEVGGFCEKIETSEDYDLGRRVSIKNQVVSVPRFTVVHYGEANTLYKKVTKERWYSKNMFDTLTANIYYKPFWISIIFMIMILILCISVAILNTKAIIYSSLCIILLSSSLSYYFCKRANNYYYIIPLIPISTAYLIGRSLGILDSVYDVVFRKYKYTQNKSEK